MIHHSIRSSLSESVRSLRNFPFLQVFFRAGVLAHLEELRDEALSVIILKFQRECRHYLALCEYKRRLDQQYAVLLTFLYAVTCV